MEASRLEPVNLHIAGAKDDSKKPRMDLVLGGFPNALWGVGEVGTFGANKYSDNGWKEVDNAVERYSNALLRHYLKYKTGEFYDRETSLPHLSHMIWNACALYESYYKLGFPKQDNLVDVNV